MERRGAERVPCRAPVRVVPYEDGYFFLDSADISPDGLFLCTDLLFGIGESLDLELRVPGRSQPVRTSARVVRVESDETSSGPGMAVQLGQLDDADRRALARVSTVSGRRARSQVGRR